MASLRITSRPDVCGGEACIQGTRIMVWTLVFYRRQGQSDAALLHHYPTLTSADLDAAWDYFRLHPDEIERAIWRNTIAANHPSNESPPAWMLVQAKLLGIPDEQICAAFDPPLAPHHLDAAWQTYRAEPTQIDRLIALSRQVA